MNAAVEVLVTSNASTGVGAPIRIFDTRWVYFARRRADGLAGKLIVRAGDIKVGCSYKPKLRMQILKSDLLAVVRGSFGLERSIHNALSPSSRIKGEWYRPTPEVLDLIRAAKSLDDAAGHYWPPQIPATVATIAEGR